MNSFLAFTLGVILGGAISVLVISIFLLGGQDEN